MKKKRWLPKVFVAGIVILAGIADLKYKGKLYQLFPRQVQTQIDDYFHEK